MNNPSYNTRLKLDGYPGKDSDMSWSDAKDENRYSVFLFSVYATKKDAVKDTNRREYLTTSTRKSFRLDGMHTMQPKDSDEIYIKEEYLVNKKLTFDGENVSEESSGREVLNSYLSGSIFIKNKNTVRKYSLESIGKKIGKKIIKNEIRKYTYIIKNVSKKEIKILEKNFPEMIKIIN